MGIRLVDEKISTLPGRSRSLFDIALDQFFSGSWIPEMHCSLEDVLVIEHWRNSMKISPPTHAVAEVWLIFVVFSSWFHGWESEMRFNCKTEKGGTNTLFLIALFCPKKNEIWYSKDNRCDQPETAPPVRVFKRVLWSRRTSGWWEKARTSLIHRFLHAAYSRKLPAIFNINS